LIIDGFYQFFNGENLFGFKITGTRISSFFGDEMIMGSYLSRLFPLLFALFLLKKKKKYEIYYIGLLFILVDILIFISGERTAFIFLNISTIFIIILIKKYQKFRLITFIVGLILIAILSFTNQKHTERMILDPIEFMIPAEKTNDKYIFTPEHDSLIKTAFKAFLEKPIFGHGPKMFRIFCKNKNFQIGEHPCSTHPHNFYLQLLAETGSIGFTFLFSSFCYVLYCGYRQLKSLFLKKRRFLSDYQVCLLSTLFITFWPLSPNGNFFNNWLMILYSLSVGFYLHSLYGKNKRYALKEFS
jgi:O-antigen ligase